MDVIIEKKGHPSRSRSEVLPIQIKDGRVLRISLEIPKSNSPSIVSLDVAENAGATPLAMVVQMPDGSHFNLLGKSNSESIKHKYETLLKAGDPFAGNVFFQPGAAGVLFGLANRLRGKSVQSGVIEAQILDQTVQVPLNHGLNPGQIPHHLHGVAFDKPSRISILQDNGDLQIKAEFEPGFYQPFWTGEASMTLTHMLKKGAYHFMMEVKNEGATRIPMGAGAHPYFYAPSGDSESVKLWIPGQRIVEIDNYSNVLPTGRIFSVSDNPDYDFRQSGGKFLKGQYLDNLWLELDLDAHGYAFSEFSDTKARVKFRMTALTKNIKGLQVYAPKPGSKPEQGVFAAMEFVTNLPDPREELWQNISTGMELLEPGQSFYYGYKIEASSI